MYQQGEAPPAHQFAAVIDAFIPPAAVPGCRGGENCLVRREEGDCFWKAGQRFPGVSRAAQLLLLLCWPTLAAIRGGSLSVGLFPSLARVSRVAPLTRPRFPHARCATRSASRG